MIRTSFRTRRIALSAALSLLVLAGSGCAEAMTRAYRVEPAIRQASFDHRCAQEGIRLVRHTAGWLSIEMDVCGTLRRYQYVAEGPLDSPGPVYVETTNGVAPGALAPRKAAP